MDQQPMISLQDLVNALKQIDDVTDARPEQLMNNKNFSTSIISNIVMSEQLAVVTEGSNKDIYVIFRGTELLDLGTWFLVNVQAASTAFRVVDDEIEHISNKLEPERKIQGAKSKVVAPGLVHQGILRTWSHLWYGSDIIGNDFHAPANAELLWFRYLFIAVAVAMIACAFSSGIPIAVMLALIAVLLSMAVESGSVERLFWRRNEMVGEPLLSHLERIPPNKRIWFVGHSLGGALATLAFAAYDNRSKCLGERRDLRLVTFASPLVGNKDFVSDFEAKHKRKFVHVANMGDPVASAPPPSPKHIWDSRHLGLISICGCLMAFISMFWAYIYPTFWEGQASYFPWTNQKKGGCLKILSKKYNYICLFWHTRGKYSELLLKDRDT